MRLLIKNAGFFVVLMLISCNGDDDPAPDPITTANIIGSVNLYDNGTNQIDNTGMTVKIDGSSPMVSATTDIDGNFTLADVPFGTYTLVYEKPGFGTFKKFEIEHTNAVSSTAIANSPSLGQMSTTQITNLETNLSGNDVIISVTTDPSGNSNNERYIRFFYSTSANVSDENYTNYSEGLISQINPYEKTLTSSDLSNMGFSSGATVYVRVYGDSFWSNEYDDPDLGRRVFPNLNSASANAVSFIVP